MAGIIPNHVRDAAITKFRHVICEKLEIVPFVHQAEWWAAADGLVLLPDHARQGGVAVRVDDGSLQYREVVARPYGSAKVLVDLGSFKIGKSYGLAVWLASFACVPGGRVQIIGLEYDICAPEFEYICEFLLSDRGLAIKPESLQNRPRDGRMWLDLPNGCRFEAKSWDRKETLKGKEIDCYAYAEAYMLPGLECYTDYSQNLRARDGFAAFATTPDRPWLKDVHDAAHSGDPKFIKWHCTCGVTAEANPFTFDFTTKERDRQLMTREKFAIHYEGRLGDFVGRVYAYQRGQRLFTPQTHPELFSPEGQLSIPPGWLIAGGADTGTFMSSLIAAFSPEGDAFFLDEFPNYSYKSSRIELGSETIPEWTKRVASRADALGMRPISFQADSNSQFKREVLHYGMHLEPNKVSPEARTEIAREYFQHDKIWLAPWLTVLPFELENACWPEDATSAGKFSRIKDRDHTLDCFEHLLSKRPRGAGVTTQSRQPAWIKEYLSLEPKVRFGPHGNVHLGTQ